MGLFEYTLLDPIKMMKNMKQFYLIFLLVFVLFTNSICSDDKSKELKLLELSYIYKSEYLFNYFFENWYNEIPSISKLKMSNLSSPESDIYNIYLDFFTPESDIEKDYTAFQTLLDSVALSYLDDKDSFRQMRLLEWPDYSSAKYILIQNNIKYSYLENLDSLIKNHIGNIDIDKIDKRDSINDFRPRVDFANKKALFLSEKYREVLDSFYVPYPGLQEYYRNLETLIIKDPYKFKDYLKHIYDKQEYLNYYIKAIPKHWSRGWYYLTFPIVTKIIFDDSIQYARIFYKKSWFSGGFADYEKTNGKWIRLKKYEPKWQDWAN